MALTEAEQVKPACRVPFLSFERPHQISWSEETLERVRRGEIKGGLRAVEWDYFNPVKPIMEPFNGPH